MIHRINQKFKNVSNNKIIRHYSTGSYDRKRIGILGGGIGGLSSYYFLNRNKAEPQSLSVILYESRDRLGGNIATEVLSDGTIVEKGPRSLRLSSQAHDTLQMIEDLSLSQDVIFADQGSKKRFIYLNQKINELPSSLNLKVWNFFRKYQLLKVGFTEIFKKSPKDLNKSTYDESVQSFFQRRFGDKITNELVDSMILGVYAGDSSKLSIRSCFPSLLHKEREYGSIILSIFRGLTSTNNTTTTKLYKKSRELKSSIFSFRNGLSQLIQSLENLIKSNPNEIELKKSCSIVEISAHQDGVSTVFKVKDSNGQVNEFDHIISTIPLHQLKRVFKVKDDQLQQLLNKVDYSSIAVVNFVFSSSVIQDQVKELGFGYLIPCIESEPILGVCIDTNTFPQFGTSEKSTIITVMVGGNKGIVNRNVNWVNVDEQQPQTIQNLAKRHLIEKLKLSKDEFDKTLKHHSVQVYTSGIPHYTVGHQELLNSIEHRLETLFGKNKFLLGGNSKNGVGINDVITTSKQLSNNLLFK
ncbi:protoporphyrinogen oxidase [Tieghemostelium lacteum]|uniref:Protoporphyrinogen oxidase n=1 Tax=Tieghemostelium lacteum TaxID=361077 RepID=A0A151ZS02_TIELA|nr:protoporphyrinogen oxidase [Tieghemostelium lacteum]|eukprot:KYQ96757.1 protoporphyrinogen oxidase [Tieghemostelium lacteum]